MDNTNDLGYERLPEAELRTQEGMEKSLIHFADMLVNYRPGCMTSTYPAHFVRANFAESTMVYRFDTEPGMANPMGFLHGGMAASFIDTTMGSLSFYMAGEKFTPTITMKLDYVRTGVIGQPVYVGCRCTRCGRTLCLSDVPAPALPQLDGFVIDDAEYVLKGLCPQCSGQAGR